MQRLPKKIKDADVRIQPKRRTPFLKLSQLKEEAPVLAAPVIEPLVFEEAGQKIEHSINLLPDMPKKEIPLREMLKEVSVVVIVGVLALTGLQSAKIIASSLNTKQSVLGATKEGLSQLKEAQALLTSKDFVEAEQKLLSARNSFGQARQDIADLGLFINSVLQLSPQGKTGTELVDAGNLISQAALDLNSFYQIVGQIKATPAGFDAPDGFYGTANAAKKYLEAGNGKLLLAQQKLKNIDPQNLPEQYKQEFSAYRDNMDTVLSAAGYMQDLLDLFQNFFGPGQKNVLVLFQNNNELRATGGFIGTQGLFKFNNGKISSQKITSVYDLDGQIKEKIAPPGPFFGMTAYWGLRDSNWFIDFPQSARKAISFYEKSAGQTPDAVVAVTPDVFVDLLKIVGPVDMPKYGLSLSAESFRDEVQKNTTLEGALESSAPKQLLADFAPALLQKVADAPDGKRTELLAVLFNNLSSKNILFYDRNQEIQKRFEAYNWSGAIADTDSDYLGVYASNQGGKKTDLDIDQKATLNTEVLADGSILNTLSYTRTHTMRTNALDKNISYVRFAVPEGSKLVSAKGFSQRKYHSADGTDLPEFGPYKTDADLNAIDQSASVDQQSGTVTSSEAGKTTFGNWIETAPGHSSTVTIKYILPFKADNLNRFSILFQKQPGSTGINLNYQLMFKKKPVWYTPSSLKVNGGKVSFTQNISTDQIIGVVFEK